MHTYVRTQYNWACAISKGSLLQRSLMVSFNFNSKRLSLQQLFVLCEQQSSILLHFMNHASSLWPPVPPLNNNKKHSRNKSQNSFMNESKPMDGTLKNQSEHNGSETTILSQHRYILCHFANYAHYKTLHMHISLFMPGKWMHNYTSARHSALLTPQHFVYQTAHICHVCHV